MPRRVVDTKFWTSADVLDHYSVEDKYFYLYLTTNGQSTQVGIYSIPKKVISFETGFSMEVIEVLLDRFSNSYKKIIYDSETQEIALLDSLKWSLLKGGKPVADLLSRELSQVKQDYLIEKTYECMEGHWRTSGKVFDKTVMSLFEDEMANRHLVSGDDAHQSEQNRNKNIVNNYNHYQNHHQDSQAAIREKAEAVDKLETADLEKFYQENIGPVTPKIKESFNYWSRMFDDKIILEALHRARRANSPMKYTETILDNWQQHKVESLQDIIKLDHDFFE